MLIYRKLKNEIIVNLYHVQYIKKDMSFERKPSIAYMLHEKELYEIFDNKAERDKEFDLLFDTLKKINN